jgi:hypothetical protein
MIEYVGALDQAPVTFPSWFSPAVGLFGVILGATLTAFVSRGRDDQNWLWEKRIELYGKLIKFLNVDGDVWRSGSDLSPLRDRLLVLNTDFGIEIDLQLYASLAFRRVFTNYASADEASVSFLLRHGAAIDEEVDEQEHSGDATVLDMLRPFSAIARVNSEQGGSIADERIALQFSAKAARAALRFQLMQEVRTPPRVISTWREARAQRRQGRSLKKMVSEETPPWHM